MAAPSAAKPSKALPAALAAHSGSPALLHAQIIKDLCKAGTSVVIASNRPQSFPGVSKFYTMHLGKPWVVSPPPAPSRRS